MRERRRRPGSRRAGRVLGLNARNLLYIQRLNHRRHFPLADDKVRTKEILTQHGVPVPETLAILSTMAEVSRAAELLRGAGEFVVKPARGRQGGGVLVFTGSEGEMFRTAGGALMSWDDLRTAMGDILFGVHSYGEADVVLVERRIHPHPRLSFAGVPGLPDVRIIMLLGRPVMAMLRVPTRASGGRANLHKGALGIAVRMADGTAFRAEVQRQVHTLHPDNGAPLSGFRLPCWVELLDIARRAAACLPLAYLGVDLAVTSEGTPLVMEVNARPGLEIQNVNGRGLRGLLAWTERS